MLKTPSLSAANTQCLKHHLYDTEMSNDAVPQLPNPLTPLAFFPPEAAWQTTVFYYTSVGSLAVLVWDILNNLGSDFKLVSEHRINSTTVVYLTARWSTLAYLVTNVIEYTAPIGNCRKYGERTGWLYPFSMAFTSLLFLIRVHAIYNRNRFVSGLFFILWLGVIGGTSLIPISAHSAQIGPTQYCFTSANSIPDYLSASGVITLFFDTSIYLAITWRLTWVFYLGRRTETTRMKIKQLLTGENLPIFSRGLLQDGQIYYLSTAGVNLMSVILFNMHSLPLAYRFLLGVPNQVLMNIMACRVYRSTRFGLINFKSTLIPSSHTSPHSANHGGETQGAVTINFTKTTTVDHGDRDVEIELGVMQGDNGKRSLL